MHETRPFIQIRGLEHAYPLEGGGEVLALRGIDLTIERGAFVALIGPNGSGKSTLARHMNGLLLPTAGEVHVDGQATSDARYQWQIRRRVGMVFQNPENQLVASTVEEDVAFGPENLGLPPREIRARVDEALSTVGLSGTRTRPPQMLSGGQKQLVAIAGALAMQPDAIVFDEPTSMLDPGGRERVLEAVQRLNSDASICVVLITQSMEEACAARRVLVMDAGRVVMDGPPPRVFARAATLRALGLDLPPVVEIAHHLREQGLDLPTGLLTVNDVARALC